MNTRTWYNIGASCLLAGIVVATLRWAHPAVFSSTTVTAFLALTVCCLVIFAIRDTDI